MTVNSRDADVFPKWSSPVARATYLDLNGPVILQERICYPYYSTVFFGLTGWDKMVIYLLQHHGEKENICIWVSVFQKSYFRNSKLAKLDPSWFNNSMWCFQYGWHLVLFSTIAHIRGIIWNLFWTEDTEYADLIYNDPSFPVRRIKDILRSHFCVFSSGSKQRFPSLCWRCLAVASSLYVDVKYFTRVAQDLVTSQLQQEMCNNY